MASVTQERARVANTIRHHPEDHEAITAARLGLAEAKLERAIQEAVDSAPPLSASQRERLALLLAPGGAA